ncbi:MAG TPA: hypothetical protein VJ912_02505 [Candidatus Nanoarchaeia archaeon]|nr:hypothetical protein [Candidatus Nanoarchaeia archaeon]
MAFVDTETGKIYGVKEYSLKWFHERGHIEYQKSWKGIKNSYTAQSLFKITIFFTVIGLFSNLFKILALSALLGWIILGLYEEIWCWVYAFKRKKAMEGKSWMKLI